MPTEWTIFALVVIVVLSVLASRTNPKHGRPKKKFWSKLHSDPPITPRHARPKAARGDKRDKQFFEEFRYFGDVLNWWCSDEHTANRWRVQERDETLLSIASFHSPQYGRSYEVYFGSVKVGELEIEDGYHEPLRAWIEIPSARLFSSGEIREFLNTVITHVGDEAKNWQAADAALLGVVWNGQQIRPAHEKELADWDWGKLTVSFSGNADFYFNRRDREAFAEIRRDIARETVATR